MNSIKKIITRLLNGLAAKLIATRKAFNQIKVPSLQITAKPCRGSILIEFAVCMPILIILLFYINDLVKIKRYYSQTEFVGQQMANILQNIARTRDITIADIKHAASLAYLTIYPGTTMYSKNNSIVCHEFHHIPRVYMYYAKGESDGKASCTWGCWVNTKTTRTDRWGSGTLTGGGQSVTKWGTTPSSIYPTLKVEEERAKVILEVQMSWSDTYENLNGETVDSARKAFGCYLVNPKNPATATYFPSIVIFTPNSGFPETGAPS